MPTAFLLSSSTTPRNTSLTSTMISSSFRSTKCSNTTLKSQIYTLRTTCKPVLISLKAGMCLSGNEHSVVCVTRAQQRECLTGRLSTGPNIFLVLLVSVCQSQVSKTCGLLESGPCGSSSSGSSQWDTLQSSNKSS